MSARNTSTMLLTTLVLLMTVACGTSDDLLDIEVDHEYTVTGVQECSNKEGLPVRWKDMRLEMINRTLIGIYAVYIQNMEIPDTETFLLEVQLFTQDGENRSSRKMMLEFLLANTCKKIKNRENEVMNAFLDSAKWIKECPIPSGTFNIVDFRVKIQKLKPFLREGNMVLRLAMDLNGEAISCTDFDLLVRECD